MTEVPSQKLQSHISKVLKRSLVKTKLTERGLNATNNMTNFHTEDLGDALIAVLEEYGYCHRIRYSEVASDYEYISGYSRPKSIFNQCQLIRRYFPEQASCFSGISWSEDSQSPDGAEGLFVIPRWELLGSTYTEAVMVVLDALMAQNPSHREKPRLSTSLIRPIEISVARKELEQRKYSDNSGVRVWGGRVWF